MGISFLRDFVCLQPSTGYKIVVVYTDVVRSNHDLDEALLYLTDRNIHVILVTLPRRAHNRQRVEDNVLRVRVNDTASSNVETLIGDTVTGATPYVDEDGDHELLRLPNGTLITDDGQLLVEYPNGTVMTPRGEGMGVQVLPESTGVRDDLGRPIFRYPNGTLVTTGGVRVIQRPDGTLVDENGSVIKRPLSDGMLFQDVVFAIDGSPSVGTETFNTMRAIVVESLPALAVDQNVRYNVALVQLAANDSYIREIDFVELTDANEQVSLRERDILNFVCAGYRHNDGAHAAEGDRRQ